MSKKVETLKDKLDKLRIVVNAAHSLGVFTDDNWIEFAENVNDGFRQKGLKDFPAKSTSKDGKTNDRYRNLHMALCLLKKEILAIPSLGLTEDDLVWPSRPKSEPKKSPTWKEVLATEQAQSILDLLKEVAKVNKFAERANDGEADAVESIASK